MRGADGKNVARSLRKLSSELRRKLPEGITRWAARGGGEGLGDSADLGKSRSPLKFKPSLRSVLAIDFFGEENRP